jgi:hypothetical protein
MAMAAGLLGKLLGTFNMNDNLNANANARMMTNHHSADFPSVARMPSNPPARTTTTTTTTTTTSANENHHHHQGPFAATLNPCQSRPMISPIPTKQRPLASSNKKSSLKQSNINPCSFQKKSLIQTMLLNPCQKKYLCCLQAPTPFLMFSQQHTGLLAAGHDALALPRRLSSLRFGTKVLSHSGRPHFKPCR